jgi:hypothetical protein
LCGKILSERQVFEREREREREMAMIWVINEDVLGKVLTRTGDTEFEKVHKVSSFKFQKGVINYITFNLLKITLFWNIMPCKYSLTSHGNMLLPSSWYISVTLRVITPQKAIVFTFSIVRTSGLTCNIVA